MTPCPNCGAELTGDFCSRCGQRDLDLERPIGSLASELVRDTLDLDGRAADTLKVLMLRPGVLTSDYLAGRRRRYTPPLRMYLVLSVVFFLLVSWVASRGVLLDAGQVGADAARHQAWFVSEPLPRLMFFLLPVFALLLKAAFPGRLYFDHLIMSLHVHCAAYVVLMFIIPLERAASDHWLPLVLQLALAAYLAAYFYLSLRQVYGQSRGATAAKAAAVVTGYLLIFALAVAMAHRLPDPAASPADPSDGVRLEPRWRPAAVGVTDGADLFIK